MSDFASPITLQNAQSDFYQPVADAIKALGYSKFFVVAQEPDNDLSIICDGYDREEVLALCSMLGDSENEGDFDEDYE